MTPEERLKMLMDSGEYDFIKDIPTEQIWKIMFMASFVLGLEQEPCRKDCRLCKEFDECVNGRKGHENGTSIGYSVGECKDYEPCAL